jgi:hypothetical protein
MKRSRSFFTSLLLSSLEFSDTKVYAPWIRALPRNASPFCELVVLKSRTLPCGQAQVAMADFADDEDEELSTRTNNPFGIRA